MSKGDEGTIGKAEDPWAAELVRVLESQIPQGGRTQRSLPTDLCLLAGLSLATEQKDLVPPTKSKSGSHDLEQRRLLRLLVTSRPALRGQEDSAFAVSVTVGFGSSCLTSATFSLLVGVCRHFLWPSTHHPTNHDAGPPAASRWLLNRCLLE